MRHYLAGRRKDGLLGRRLDGYVRHSLILRPVPFGGKKSRLVHGRRKWQGFVLGQRRVWVRRAGGLTRALPHADAGVFREILPSRFEEAVYGQRIGHKARLELVYLAHARIG
ncbi:MAG: hypothetical protein HC850_01070 [Rhodomicrobium sp.]|nr:hypothetical protein [Rhodomicrobium sp.]